MSQCRIAELADRAVIRVSGAAAGAFLQGLITNDIDKAASGRAIHAGLLSPQGKIIFEFFLLPDGDGYLLDVARTESERLVQRLSFYRLRAEVKIEPTPLRVAAAWGDSVPPQIDGAHVFADPRLAAMGYRILLTAVADLAGLGCSMAGEGAYHAHRIALGVPEGGRDYGFGDTFPHEALYDQLAGVDFEKGCFVGQEVVSRMQHRGTARKRVVGVDGEGTLPAPGAEILAGTMPIGTLGSVEGKSGLALLRLDRAEEAKAQGIGLRAGDVPVSLRIPEWARFETHKAAAS